MYRTYWWSASPPLKAFQYSTIDVQSIGDTHAHTCICMKKVFGNFDFD